MSSVKLQALSQEAASSRQLYDALYGKLKELNVQTALRAINIGIADKALPPSTPTRPNPPLYLIRQVSFLFRTIKTTRPILLASVVAAAVSLTLVYPAVRMFGAVGIMLAAVAAQIANLACLFLSWKRMPSVRTELFETQPE